MIVSAFSVEEFIVLSGGTKLRGGELLYNPYPECNTEHFFATAPRRVLHNVFMLAVRHHIESEAPCSINVDPSYLFSNDFLSALISIKKNHINLNPEDICIEITERTDKQHFFNSQRLKMLGDIGFTLALDDVDIRESHEWDRLGQYAPYIDVIKFPYQIMQTLRGKTYPKEVFDAITKVRNLYPEKIIVMEGVRDCDDKRFLEPFKELGINYIQRSRYNDNPDGTVTIPGALIEPPFQPA